MNKKVQKGGVIGLILVLGLSVFANFHSPLYWNRNSIPEINLSFNVKDPNYQPIFINKCLGVTELINAKVECEPILNDSIIKIKEIRFNTIKLSGLMSHKFKDVVLDIDKFGKPYITMEMRFLQGEEDTLIKMKDIKYPIVKKAFEFSAHKGQEIATFVDYGFSDKISKLIQRIRNKELSLSEAITIIDRENGNICNINTVYEELER